MGRPTVALITRDATIRAALEILERDGLGGFSLRRLAQELGVNQASFYYHFEGGRADILATTARAVLAEIEIPPPSDDWIDWMTQVGVRYRRFLIHRPFLVDIMVGGYRPRTEVMEFGEARLAEAGVPRDCHAPLLESLESMVVGSALVSIARRRASAAEARSPMRDHSADGADEVDERLLTRSLAGLVTAALDDPTLLRPSAT